jgi:hypothetical protein
MRNNVDEVDMEIEEIQQTQFKRSQKPNGNYQIEVRNDLRLMQQAISRP